MVQNLFLILDHSYMFSYFGPIVDVKSIFHVSVKISGKQNVTVGFTNLIKELLGLAVNAVPYHEFIPS